jgi:hypothetical protein
MVDVAVGLVEVLAGDAVWVLVVILRPWEIRVLSGELRDGVASDAPHRAVEVVSGVPGVAVGAVP